MIDYKISEVEAIIRICEAYAGAAYSDTMQWSLDEVIRLVEHVVGKLFHDNKELTFKVVAKLIVRWEVGGD